MSRKERGSERKTETEGERGGERGGEQGGTAFSPVFVVLKKGMKTWVSEGGASQHLAGKVWKRCTSPF